MFLVGLELDLRSLRSHLRNSLIIAGTGLLVPFALAAPIGYILYIKLADSEKVSVGNFVLFILVSMSITAFPVLARIMSDRNLFTTRVGITAISAAAVGDAVGWLLLAVVVSVVSASTPLAALWAFLCGIGLTLFLFLVVRRGLSALMKLSSTRESLNTFMIFVVYFLVLAASWFTEAIGIHAIFGAFLVGLVVPHDNGFAIQLTEKTEDFVAILLVPLYFAYSGLRTKLGVLNDGLVWGLVVLVISGACVGKIFGSAIPSRILGLSWRESWTVGFLMNTKGLVELIVLNVGLDAGVLNEKSFVVMTIMAIVTTLITAPVVSFIYPQKYHVRIHARDPHHAGDDAVSVHSRTSRHLTRRHKAENRFSILHEMDALSSFVGQKPANGSNPFAPVDVAGLNVLVCLIEQHSLPGFMSLLHMVGSYFKMTAAQGAAAASAERAAAVANAAQSPKGSANGSGASALQALFAGGNKEDSTATTLPREGSTPLFAMRSSESQQHEPAQLSVVALRLVAMTDRTSAIMAELEQETTMLRDPLLNVFRTFAQINKISCLPSLAVRQPELFPEEIVQAADECGAGLVLMPLTSHSALEGDMSRLEGWFERQYRSRTVFVTVSRKPLVSDVLSRCPATVGVFVDHGFGGFVQGGALNATSSMSVFLTGSTTNVGTDFPALSTPGVGNVLGHELVTESGTTPGAEEMPQAYLNASVRMLVIFTGGKDDRTALAFALRLLGHPNVALDVLRVIIDMPTKSWAVPSDAEEDERMWKSLKEGLLTKRMGPFSSRLSLRERTISENNDDLIKLTLEEVVKLRKSDLVICGRGTPVVGKRIRADTVALLETEVSAPEYDKHLEAEASTKEAPVVTESTAIDIHHKPGNARLELLRDEENEHANAQTHQSTHSTTAQRLAGWIKVSAVGSSSSVGGSAVPPSPSHAHPVEHDEVDDAELGALGVVGSALVVTASHHLHHSHHAPLRMHDRTSSVRSIRAVGSGKGHSYFEHLGPIKASVLVMRGPMFSESDEEGEPSKMKEDADKMA
ncbi:K(+)/H(+) antiporter [Gonapodya sp. JEL0774]|nr:K(+)/H(+) antiporter [Gonapodya sp. JEL0774]